jgi:hypothetical protein
MAVSVPETVEILSRTPPTLRAMLGGVGEAWTTADEGPDTFSPRDVLGHLIVGEETDWIPRLRIILDQGAARAFDPFDRFAFRTRYAGRTVGELLDIFARLRGENLRTLAGLGLGPSDLERPGRHPELGPVTLGQLLATWVVHDLNHLGQVSRVMAKRYGTEVGPWRAYLRILSW